MRDDLTKEDLKWIVPTFLILLFLLFGEVWPEHRNEIRLGLKIAGGLVGCAAVFFFVRTLRGPFGYRSLRSSKEYLLYEESSKSKHLVPWRDISRIRFIRREAIFEDMDGPYLETYWQITTVVGTDVEIASEWANRSFLLRVFRRRLIGFNVARAKQALSAVEEGEWVCFERQPNHALQATFEDSRA